MSEQPANYYSTNGLLGASATSGALRSFGFPATYLRVYNGGSVDLYLNLRGLNACTMSTALEHVIAAGTAEAFPLALTPIGAVALWTTSTGASGQRVSTLALG